LQEYLAKRFAPVKEKPMRETFPNPDAVPAPSEEYERGHRDGYAQRMSEENSDLDMGRTVTARADHDAEVKPGDVIKIRCHPSVARHFGGEVVEERSEISYPRQTAAVPGNEGAASFRPQAPSLNECWNRLNAHREILEAALEESADHLEAIRDLQNDRDCNEERWNDHWEATERQQRKLEERIAGDVHALNERMCQIEDGLEVVKSMIGPGAIITYIDPNERSTT
jgi:hypothetical protein